MTTDPAMPIGRERSGPTTSDNPDPPRHRTPAADRARGHGDNRGLPFDPNPSTSGGVSDLGRRYHPASCSPSLGTSVGLSSAAVGPMVSAASPRAGGLLSGRYDALPGAAQFPTIAPFRKLARSANDVVNDGPGRRLTLPIGARLRERGRAVRPLEPSSDYSRGIDWRGRGWARRAHGVGNVVFVIHRCDPDDWVATGKVWASVRCGGRLGACGCGCLAASRSKGWLNASLAAARGGRC